MHALWDQILGEDFALRTMRRRYAEIVTSAELRAVGEQAVGIPGGLDPQVWLEESRKAAVEHVYTPEVLQSLSIVVRGLAEKPQVLTLSEEYLKNAGGGRSGGLRKGLIGWLGFGGAGRAVVNTDRRNRIRKK